MMMTKDDDDDDDGDDDDDDDDDDDVCVLSNFKVVDPKLKNSHLTYWKFGIYWPCQSLDLLKINMSSHNKPVAFIGVFNAEFSGFPLAPGVAEEDPPAWGHEHAPVADHPSAMWLEWRGQAWVKQGEGI